MEKGSLKDLEEGCTILSAASTAALKALFDDFLVCSAEIVRQHLAIDDVLLANRDARVELSIFYILLLLGK